MKDPTAEHQRLVRQRKLSGLAKRPVIAAVLKPADVSVFLHSGAIVGFLAQLDLLQLNAAVKQIRKTDDKLVFVNIDSIVGLAQDTGGIDFLAHIGVDGVVTTRGSLVSRVNDTGLLSVQKLFITDQSNMLRGVTTVRKAKPDLLQLMPAPVLPFVAKHDIMRVRPVIAGGFISDEAGVRTALGHGAVGVSVSTPQLWNYRQAE